MDDSLLKYWTMDFEEEEPKLVPVYYMTPGEIAERDALNIANTASALRARVIEELAKANGDGGSKYPQ